MAVLGTLQTFKGGHYFGQFEGTPRGRIQSMPLPQRVIIFLKQGFGEAVAPLVKEGDKVLAGQIIGRDDEKISTPIHASISGVVRKIEDRPHPLGGFSKAIIIESDGKDQWQLLERASINFERMSPDEVGLILYQAGVTDGGKCGFPTSFKSSPANPARIKFLLINAVETEPYLEADNQLLYEEFEKFVTGIRILRSALGNVAVHIGIGYNRPRLIEELEVRFEYHDWLHIHPLRPKYPQGDDEILIRTLLGLSVPSGGYAVDIGAVVCEVQHTIAAYEAVIEGKPFIERVISIGGSAVAEPVNLKVRVGTPIGEIFKKIKVSEPARIILGGVMRGLAQNDHTKLAELEKQLTELEARLKAAPEEEKMTLAPQLNKLRTQRRELSERIKWATEAPITRNTPAVIALSEAQKELMPIAGLGFDKDSFTKAFVPLPWVTKRASTSLNGLPRPCVKCGYCTDVCPSNLVPIMIAEFSMQDMLLEAQELDIFACIECGLCTYVCPSKIPVMTQILEGKRKIREET